MSEIHALSGAYSIDALDHDERTQFDDHLAVCAECRAEVASFRDTAALLTDIDAETPPADLRSRVLADIKNVRPLPPALGEPAPADDAVEPVRPSAPRHIATAPSLTRRWMSTVVAAAVVILIGVLFSTHPWSSSGSGRSDLADQIVHAKDAVSTTQDLPNGGHLTLVRSASLKRAVMVADHVTEPAAGTVYQLWLKQPGTGLVSAGLMPDTQVATVLAGDAATATLAAVSVEPETGSVTPHGIPIAKFNLKAT